MKLTDVRGTLTDMGEERDQVEGGSPRIPSMRRAEREVGIRELRNAGAVVAALAEADAVGRVTSGGRLVGWLVPATAAEQRADELAAAARLRGGRPGGLAGRRSLPRRIDTAPLSESLERLRREEDR